MLFTVVERLPRASASRAGRAGHAVRWRGGSGRLVGRSVGSASVGEERVPERLPEDPVGVRRDGSESEVTSHQGGRVAVGRPRRAQVDRAILDAALRLVRRRGPGGVTVEAVAAESGVAKTTIYRRYRNRSELLRAAMTQLVDIPAPAPELPLRDQLIMFLSQFRTGMEEGIGLRAIAALLSAEDDRVFAEAARSNALSPRLRQLLGLFRAAVVRGELRPEADYQRVAELLIGSYLARAALAGQDSIDGEWPAVVVDLVLRAVSDVDRGR